MARRVEGKVAIVTGGGSGMGRAGATLLAAEGARVVVAEISQEKGMRVCQSIKEARLDATFIPVDVRDAESVKELVAKTLSCYGRIDVLYHNAVDARFVNEEDRRLTELPEKTWNQMIDLVLTGTFLCCKYVGRQMLAQRAGSIILSSSADALIGCAGLDSYTAAKGGIVAMRVNAICPGLVTTESQLKWYQNQKAQALTQMLHLLPVATPEQIAPFVLYLASDESAVVTGGIFSIDSGYMAFKANLDVMAATRGELDT
jgi:NAD(P)-dependent dehydrogenase (short-subunit alcohol dehydrogenase family)